MCHVSFRCLAGGAALDIVGDKSRHIRPPIVFGNQMTGFEHVEVAGSGGVME